MTILRWQEVSRAPAGPGVYAWYYEPEISQYDLDVAVADVEACKRIGDMAGAADLIRTFLDVMVFRNFREQPYVAELRAPLKPRFEGLVDHVPMLSESLVARLVEDPARLATIRRVLEASAPNFASPLYIGMSERLRSRLGRHKALIERYGEARSPSADDERRDQSFAREVNRRCLAPTRLFVVVNEIPGPSGVYVDCENILNRIHHPLLGRN